MTLNLEENVSCKNLIWFDTKLLRRQWLVSDARRNVRLYSRIKDRKSPLKGSRPSVPHGTNFWHKSFILDDVKPAELSNNSFEWKNDIWGGDQNILWPIQYFQRGRTPNIPRSTPLQVTVLRLLLWFETAASLHFTLLHELTWLAYFFA